MPTEEEEEEEPRGARRGAGRQGQGKVKISRKSSEKGNES
jgi:hypothetical protein